MHYERIAPALCEQQMQESLALKQKYLDPKAKKTNGAGGGGGGGGGGSSAGAGGSTGGGGGSGPGGGQAPASKTGPASKAGLNASANTGTDRKPVADATNTQSVRLVIDRRLFVRGASLRTIDPPSRPSPIHSRLLIELTSMQLRDCAKLARSSGDWQRFKRSAFPTRRVRNARAFQKSRRVSIACGRRGDGARFCPSPSQCSVAIISPRSRVFAWGAGVRARRGERKSAARENAPLSRCALLGEVVAPAPAPANGPVLVRPIAARSRASRAVPSPGGRRRRRENRRGKLSEGP